MTSRRAAIASARRIILLFLVIFVGIWLARGFVLGTSPLTTMVSAGHRIFTIAFADGVQLGWLILLCAGAGVFVMSDRRRRTKVRRASS
jgi:hypothetical protein